MSNTRLRLHLTAGLDALARADDGLPAQPGDAELIAFLDANLQAASDRYWDQVVADQHAEWLASQCGGCEPGGTGEACDDHWDGDA